MAQPNQQPQDPNQQQPPANQTREREVIVTDGGSRSSNVGTVIAAVIGLLVVLLVGWFLFMGGTGDGGDGSVVPDEVNVDVNPGDGGGGDGGGDAGS